MVDEVKSWFAGMSAWATALVALVAYAAGVLVWGTRIDLRVGSIEAHMAAIDSRVDVLTTSDRTITERLLIVDERQQSVLRRLDDNAKRLDQIGNITNDTNSLLRNHDNRNKSPSPSNYMEPSYPPP